MGDEKIWVGLNHGEHRQTSEEADRIDRIFDRIYKILPVNPVPNLVKPVKKNLALCVLSGEFLAFDMAQCYLCIFKLG